MLNYGKLLIPLILKVKHWFGLNSLSVDVSNWLTSELFSLIGLLVNYFH